MVVVPALSKLAIDDRGFPLDQPWNPLSLIKIVAVLLHKFTPVRAVAFLPLLTSGQVQHFW